MDNTIRRDETVARDADDVDTEGHASTGGAMAAGAATGAVVGLVGGPVGAVVGAVGGAVVGAVTERVMHGESGHEHIEGDEVHYRDDHTCSGMDSCTHDHTCHYTSAAMPRPRPVVRSPLAARTA